MKGLIDLICSLAFLLVISAQFPNLSPSYSLQGNLGRIENDVAILSGSYSVSVDITRRLQFVEEIVSTGIDTSYNLKLSSLNDNATYLSENGLCNETAFNPSVIFPPNAYLWDLYDDGLEYPKGTYTFTQDGTIHQLMIVDGIPALIGIRSGNTVIVIFVTDFNNFTPPFSTFSVPSECSQFTCNACYQTSQFPTLSPSYSLVGDLTRTENGVPVSTATYSVSVDITRRLRFVDETVTTSLGDISNNLRLSSEDDSATYLSVSNVCTKMTFDPKAIFPTNTNVWNLYTAGIEADGTYTFTQDSTVYRVTIVNGEPSSFTFTTGTTVIAITGVTFNNMTPAFSTFCLPSECSQFTCNACYSSAVSVSISIMLLLTTLLVYLFTTL